MKKSLIFVVVAALLVVLVPGCATQGGQAVLSGQGASPPSGEEVNFRLLISDEPIDDFDQIWVNITQIGVRQGGESGSWIELPDFEPVEVDLKQLIEDNATEIWSGHLEPGVYSKVFIYVDNIRSVPEANIKLPSDRLQISIPFEVANGTVTNFIYDITLIKAGKSGMYILKPQIADSGPDQPFNEVTPNGESEEVKEEKFEGTILSISGDNWTMEVGGETWQVDVSEADIEGEPAEGLEAKVEGTVVGDKSIKATEVEVEEPEEEEPEGAS